MCRQKIDRLKTWAVGLRLMNDDPLPQWATIVAIEQDFAGFMVEWEGGEVERLPIDEVDSFQTEGEAQGGDLDFRSPRASPTRDATFTSDG